MTNNSLIRDARKKSGLSVENFAALTRIGRHRLEQIEADHEQASTQDLDAVARVFGVELADFMGGALGASTLFFRSMGEDVVLDDILSDGDGLVLGDFLRCVGRVGELRRRVGEPLPSPAWLDDVEPQPIDSRTPPWEQGEDLAAKARAYFAVGKEPIPSVREFLLSQGIDVFFLTPGQLQAHIDGASTIRPAPVVLVNPIYEAAPWSVRATMAHELCHLLYDRQSRDLFMVSPTSRERTTKRGARQWQLFDKYLDMEKRASAFAAHFLAPLGSVRAVVSEAACAPASGEAALLVSNTFGVSYETAVNLLWREYSLAKHTREHLLYLPKDHSVTFDYHELPKSRGLFEGQLRDLALKAFTAGHLTRVEVRRLLEIPMDSPLPQGEETWLTEDQRAPLITHRQRALKQAARHLLQNDPSGTLSPDQVTATEDGWEITVKRVESDGTSQPAGTLSLSHDLELRRPNLF